jgi:hypothetical protein
MGTGQNLMSEFLDTEEDVKFWTCIIYGLGFLTGGSFGAIITLVIVK